VIIKVEPVNRPASGVATTLRLAKSNI
jgi:hypothetical protein